MADAEDSSPGTFLKKIRVWKPRFCKKPLTDGLAQGALVKQSIGEVQPAPATPRGNQLLQFGAVQHYNNYPGIPSTQQMMWANAPQYGNASASQAYPPAFHYPIGMNQHEEGVTVFNVGTHQGYHGVSVTLKPKTYLELSPEQQMGLIHLGASNGYYARPPPVPPKLPHYARSEPAVSVIEEVVPEGPGPTALPESVAGDPAPPASPPPSEAPQPAGEAHGQKCFHFNGQVMINILPHLCSTVPLCGRCHEQLKREEANYHRAHA